MFPRSPEGTFSNIPNSLSAEKNTSGMSTLLKSPDAARKNAAKKNQRYFAFGIFSGIIKLPNWGESNLIQMLGKFVGVPL